MLKSRIENVYELVVAKTNTVPLVFDSPHSGSIYPDDFDYACSFDALRRAEDNDVDDLFSYVPQYGAAYLKALFPRTYIDVNRAVDDIDINILNEPWPYPMNPTARSHAGIGLIRRVLRPGVAVYNRKLTAQDIQDRIDRYYLPYHDVLQETMDSIHYHFGEIWHINCHSMPSGRQSHVRSSMSIFSHQPDFVLGNRDGTTCDIEFTRLVREYLRSLGYRVSINNPYRGVELIRKYSNPAQGRHSIQIEINKGLYWDEILGQRSKNYNTLKADLEKLVQYCAGYIKHNLVDRAAD